jgi:hypothetical protein
LAEANLFKKHHLFTARPSVLLQLQKKAAAFKKAAALSDEEGI